MIDNVTPNGGVDEGPWALLVIDMQRGLFEGGKPRQDADELVARLNRLAAQMRAYGHPVIFIRHCGPEGHGLHPSQPGHAFRSDLIVTDNDLIVSKSSCDAFLDTDLEDLLTEHAVHSLIVTGYATEYCVDTTIRSALGHGYRTLVPVDGHTTADRSHLSAARIIQHHNAVWADFLSPAGAAIPCRCADVWQDAIAGA